MRYVTIPPDQTILEAEPIGNPPQQPKLSLRGIVASDLGSVLSWRADDAAMASYAVTIEAFLASKPGDVIPMRDEDHERLVACFRAFPSFNPTLIPYVMRLFMAVTSAPRQASQQQQKGKGK